MDELLSLERSVSLEKTVFFHRVVEARFVDVRLGYEREVSCVGLLCPVNVMHTMNAINI